MACSIAGGGMGCRVGYVVLLTLLNGISPPQQSTAETITNVDDVTQDHANQRAICTIASSVFCGTPSDLVTTKARGVSSARFAAAGRLLRLPANRADASVLRTPAPLIGALGGFHLPTRSLESLRPAVLRLFPWQFQSSIRSNSRSKTACVLWRKFGKALWNRPRPSSSHPKRGSSWPNDLRPIEETQMPAQLGQR